MKKIIYGIFALAVAIAFTSCGTSYGVTDTPAKEEEDNSIEELFLQQAHWYLQADEQVLFSWEQGEIESNYFIEGTRTIIGPEGEIDIHGQTVTRVKYVYRDFGNIQELVNLYFDEDIFLGTDYGCDGPDGYTAYEKPFWDGDISFWVFLDAPFIPADGSMKVSCVLHNNSDVKREFTAYSPKITYIDFYQGGKSIGNGINASEQELILDPDQTYVETYSWDLTSTNNLNSRLFSGPCTLLAFVQLREIPINIREPGLEISLIRTAEFIIVDNK